MSLRMIETRSVFEDEELLLYVVTSHREMLILAAMTRPYRWYLAPLAGYIFLPQTPDPGQALLEGEGLVRMEERLLVDSRDTCRELGRICCEGKCK